MHVQSASLATEPPTDGFAHPEFDYARAFQNRVAEWAHDDGEPVAVLRAPTGAGKTATFHEVIEENNLTLIVYPTNALLNQQLERFREENIDVEPLTSETLSGHGDERTENLLRRADWIEGHDIVVTNPDILQAIIQDLYHGSTKPMQFFNRFGGIIYDEFHFYDDFAASGLLLQMHIFGGRQANPDMLLASATPNDSFVSFVKDELALPVRSISSEYVSGGDQFRYPVTVERHEDHRINDDREGVAERLEELVENADNLEEPRVALVFNSVAASNDFHQFLAEEYPDVFDYVAKDNGFDTDDPDAILDDKSFFVLNTTSKGEVGLDYDIRALFMETPRSPSAFLQRFGRAGREHEATVHVFGLGDMAWPDELRYPEFVESIYDALGAYRSQDEAIATLRSLVGMRAAYAIHTRMDDDSWFGPELFEDFASVSEYGTWRSFIESIHATLDHAGEFGSPVRQNSPARKLLDFTSHCFEAFSSLRGRSMSVDIKYPRGDRQALTSYDLLTTLRYYDIVDIEADDTLVVERRDTEQPVAITARFPGYENRPRDYSGSTSDLEQMFSEWLYPQIDKADLAETDVGEGLLRQFFSVLTLPEVVLPLEVRYDHYAAYVDQSGIPSVDVERRQL